MKMLHAICGAAQFARRTKQVKITNVEFAISDLKPTLTVMVTVTLSP